MITRNYRACLHAVPNQGTAPASFLDELIDVMRSLPDEVFAVNGRDDIYGIIRPRLGPWQGILHRRAALCEALRVDAGLESGWDWNCGADPAAGKETPLEMETGAFQVSANSMAFDASLSACLDRICGAHDAQTFIRGMKANHALAIEYCARLFRFSTRWSGPCNRGWIAENVLPEAVTEVQSFLL